MTTLKILYIDDHPEAALSKYLDNYKNSNCEIEYSDIEFNPDEGYESLINDPDVKSANIIFRAHGRCNLFPVNKQFVLRSNFYRFKTV